MEFSLKFWIGIILLVTNQPFGWGAMILCGALAIKTKKKFFYFLGLAVYALSWGMLGLGFLLAGPEGIKYSRDLLKSLWINPKMIEIFPKELIHNDLSKSREYLIPSGPASKIPKPNIPQLRA